MAVTLRRLSSGMDVGVGAAPTKGRWEVQGLAAACVEAGGQEGLAGLCPQCCAKQWQEGQPLAGVQ